MTFSLMGLKRVTGVSTFQNVLRSISNSGNDATDKIYEFRQYNLKPDSVAQFMKISKEKIHLRLAHSKLIGYFMAEFGGINQALHVWEYDSYDHRRSVREKLSNDPDWIAQYVQPVFPLFTHQTNALLRRVQGWGVGFDANAGESKSVYEMRIRLLKPGAETLVIHRLEESHLYHSPPAHMLALWRGVFGPIPSLYSRHRFSSFDDRDDKVRDDMLSEQIRETNKFLDSFSLQVSNLALTPTPWSPLK